MALAGVFPGRRPRSLQVGNDASRGHEARVIASHEYFVRGRAVGVPSPEESMSMVAVCAGRRPYPLSCPVCSRVAALVDRRSDLAATAQAANLSSRLLARWRNRAPRRRPGSALHPRRDRQLPQGGQGVRGGDRFWITLRALPGEPRLQRWQTRPQGWPGGPGSRSSSTIDAATVYEGVAWKVRGSASRPWKAPGCRCASRKAADPVDDTA